VVTLEVSLFMMNIIKTTSRRQGRESDRSSEGRPFANSRADEQKSHRRRSILMSQPIMTKSTKERYSVNVAIAGRKFMPLPGEICLTLHSSLMGALYLAINKVIKQKSAESILARWHS